MEEGTPTAPLDTGAGVNAGKSYKKMIIMVLIIIKNRKDYHGAEKKRLSWC